MRKFLLVCSVLMVLVLVCTGCTTKWDKIFRHDKTWEDVGEWQKDLTFHAGKSFNTEKSANQWVYFYDNIRLLEEDYARFWLVDDFSMLSYLRTN